MKSPERCNTVDFAIITDSIPNHIATGKHHSDSPMSDERTLIDVKQALADKYERLSRIAGSDTKRKQLAYRAVKYQRQVEQLKRDS